MSLLLSLLVRRCLVESAQEGGLRLRLRFLLGRVIGRKAPGVCRFCLLCFVGGFVVWVYCVALHCVYGIHLSMRSKSLFHLAIINTTDKISLPRGLCLRVRFYDGARAQEGIARARSCRHPTWPIFVTNWEWCVVQHTMLFLTSFSSTVAVIPLHSTERLSKR